MNFKNLHDDVKNAKLISDFDGIFLYIELDLWKEFFHYIWWCRVQLKLKCIRNRFKNKIDWIEMEVKKNKSENRTARDKNWIQLNWQYILIHLPVGRFKKYWLVLRKMCVSNSFSAINYDHNRFFHRINSLPYVTQIFLNTS